MGLQVDAPKEESKTDLTSGTAGNETDGAADKVAIDSATDAPASPDADDKCSEGGSDVEFPFVSKRISVVEAPKFRELRQLREEEEGPAESTEGNEGNKQEEPEAKTETETTSLLEELELYKHKTRELEFKVEEINEIWKSKSDASEKERDELQRRVNERTKSLIAFEEKLTDLKKDLTIKNKIIAEKDKTIAELKKTITDKERLISESARAIEDKEKILQERDMVIADKTKALSEKDKLIGEKNKIVSDIKSAESGREAAFEDTRRKLEQEYKEQLGNQEALIAQREANIRNLDAAVRARDERLREKDDILRTLNSTLEEHKREMTGLGEKLTRSAASMREKEAVISVLRAQLPEASVLAHDGPSKDGGETDAEKEGYRLKAALQKAQLELRERDAERAVLQEKLEQSRRALEDAMVNWDKDRGVFQGEINVLEEKVRLFEMYNPRGGRESEAVDGLKKELSECFQEREALVTELSTIRLRMDAEERAHKGELAKLQGELTEKLKMLKSEVDNNARVSVELDRLRRQLLTIDKLQKERDRDRETVVAIQKNLSLVKDKYTEELLKSEEDKGILGRQRAELEESRGHLELLQRHLRELREKTSDQDRLRSDLINRFSTERASWEIDRANLHSQINQLREHISCSSREEDRSKDIQVNMGLAWEKERGEQRRLLQEAHTLALDLQEQLRTRDEASSHDRKELVRELETERQNLAKIRRDWEKRTAEIDTSNRKLTALQARISELQTAVQKDRDTWSRDRTQLSRQLAEVSNAHARDVKQVEDVLSNLIRLRELGTMALPDDTRRGSDPDDQTKTCVVSQAVYQMNRATDDLTAITSPSLLDKDAIKKISASEMDLVKQEFTQAKHTPITNKVDSQLSSVAPQDSHKMDETTGHLAPRPLTSVSQAPVSNSPSMEKALTTRTTVATTTTTTATKATTKTTTDYTTAIATKTGQPSMTTQTATTVTDKSCRSEVPGVLEVTEPKYHRQKDLSKEQQKQLQKELKKKKEEEEQLLKKQKKKTKEGGGLSAIFGRHKHEKDSAKSSTLSPPQPQSLVVTTSTATTTTLSTASPSPTSTSSPVTSSAVTSRPSPDTVPSLTPRPFDLRRPERPPSYASGTRSAQGSRATTPEVPDMATWPKKAAAGQSSVADQRYQQASEMSSPSNSAFPPVESTGKPKRPVGFSKSISVDSAPVVLDVSPSRHFLPTHASASFSVDSQDRQQWTAADLTSFFSSLPAPRPSSSPRVPVISLSTVTSTSAATSTAGLRPHSASPHRDKLSPRSTRRKFFEEYPTSSSSSPTSGTPTTPTLTPASAYEDLRRSVSPSRQSVDEEEFTNTNNIYQHAQAPPSQMSTSASWDEKMHYRISQVDTSTATSSKPSQTHHNVGKPAELSAKQKRSFFKKSSSLDSTPVSESIAQAGVAATPVAAPSNFAPSDFFAAVKGRLKPVFKRKSGGGTKDSSPGVQAEACPDVVRSVQQEAVSAHAHDNPVDSTSVPEDQDEDEREYVAELPPPRERSRDGGRRDRSSNSPQGKWRSKSADRVTSHAGTPVHGDVIRPVSGTWTFNETAV
ncbi:coiled-coil domain-containing protein 165 [Elysia marginata]|uniref:Coiled-coil domain-containing protein 165 n=1 Tax=Elysia marginata TaxID=1093978 RepID=A0AAV4JBT5_9GAST|nr:coiled-coil domain-containing protein 165 [Elysia marginata]